MGLKCMIWISLWPKDSKVLLSKPSPLSIAKKIKDDACDLCKLVVSFLDDQLKQNSTDVRFVYL